MDNIDRLLSSIKAEREQNVAKVQDTSPPAQGSPAAPSESSPLEQVVAQPRSIDDLLHKLHGEPSTPVVPPSAPSDRLQRLKETLTSERVSSPPPQPTISPSALPVLNDLKAEFEEQQRQAQAEQRRQEAERQREEERLERERQAALEQDRLARERAEQEKRRQREREVQNWLKQLDPLSSEGIWFEEFAAHYESRLQAAIAYLDLEAES